MYKYNMLRSDLEQPCWSFKEPVEDVELNTQNLQITDSLTEFNN